MICGVSPVPLEGGRTKVPKANAQGTGVVRDRTARQHRGVVRRVTVVIVVVVPAGDEVVKRAPGVATQLVVNKHPAEHDS